MKNNYKNKKDYTGKPARFKLLQGLKEGDLIDKQDIFAVFVDGTPGETEIDIHGKQTFVDDTSFLPEIGENVLLEDRGLVSLTSGVLVFTPYKIDIVEQKVENETINWADNTKVYEGDTVVTGDIKKGGQIKCTGNLIINGSVYESYIVADGQITINGAVHKSVIYSGFSKLAAKQVEAFSLQYLLVIERVMFETNFTAQEGTNYFDKGKSLELAKSEFKAINQSTTPFLSIVDEFGEEKTQKLFNKFSTLVKNTQIVTLNDVSTTREIQTVMQSFYDFIETTKKHFCDFNGKLKTESATSSQFYSFRDVIIFGTGTHQSTIDSHQSVIVKGRCLSTTVTANKSIVIKEFTPGSSRKCKVVLKNNNGYIKINKLSADSIVHINNRKIIIEKDTNNAYFDKNRIC